MGTRADFYVGRGPDAEWIGSIPFDGYPVDHHGNGIDFDRSDERHFREGVAHLVADERGTTPEMGWPWPWEDSGTTDFAYAWDDGQVWVSSFGRAWVEFSRWHEYDSEEDTPRGDGPPAEFPNMKDVQNVTCGKRSGLIVLDAEGVLGLD